MHWTLGYLQIPFIVFTFFLTHNAAAFIKFLEFLLWHLFKEGVCFKLTFLKSMTTITINHLQIFIFVKLKGVTSFQCLAFFVEIES